MIIEPERVKPAKYRKFHGVWDKLMKAYAVAILIYHVAYILHIPEYFGLYVSPQPFLFFSLAIVLNYAFLVVPVTKNASRDKLPWYDAAIALVSMALPLYLFFTYSQKMLTLGLITNLYELILGIVMLIAILEMMRRTTGWILTTLIILSILYALYCNHFPGFFHGRGYSIERVAGFLTQTSDGVFGVAYRVAVTIIICYMLFARFLEESGAGNFFINLSNSLVGGVRGGPAKVAVIASGMFGTISGSAPANVAATGVFTIPMMKRAGFKPEFAGAVEAVASTGGQIMPPVMGAIAFIIADILEISYWSVCVAAALPALFYYFSAFMQVDFWAARKGLKGLPRQELPPFRKTLAAGWLYIVPVAMIIVLLAFFNLTPEAACLYSLAVQILLGIFKKEMRLGPKKLISAIETGVRSFLDIGTICAGVGMIIGAVALTGLGLHLSSELVRMAGGSLFTLLLLAAISSFILGCGLPSLPCYIILVILVAPALAKLEVMPLAAHLFIFYCALASFITPPVCVAVYVACGIADSPMMRTGFQAVRLGIVVYLIPFFFVYRPALLLRGTVLEVAWAVFTGVCGVVFLASGLQGYLLKKVGWLLRGLLLICGFALFLIDWRIEIMGACIGGLVLLWQGAGQRLFRSKVKMSTSQS